MQIDQEFKSLMPALTNEEYRQLEENIIKEGCRDALVTWNDTLIDGHQRYEICTKNNIPFKTVAKELENREEVIVWIIKNQLGKKNMSDYSKGSKKLSINLLKKHPKNLQIYGEDNISELAKKIKETGWIKPLIITDKNIIISGHRRYNACMLLNIQDVPVEVKSFNNEQEELESLLLENMYRDKTMEQKVREAEIWEVIEKAKAEKRRLSTQNNNVGKAVKENFPELVTGQTRDIVAKQVGIGSGKTLESAKIVVKKIDELRELGDVENAEFLSNALNKSVSGAKKLAEENIADKVPGIVQEQVKAGELTINGAYILTKSAIETRRKNEENLKQYEENLAKEKLEREEKQSLKKLEASLPENAVLLNKFRKPEETHIFGITDFNNLTEEQFDKCLIHAKKYKDAICRMTDLYTELDSMRAWEAVLCDNDELTMWLDSISQVIQKSIAIQNYLKGVKK